MFVGAGVAVAVAVVAGVGAQHIAVDGGDFVQHAVFRPKVERAVGGGRGDYRGAAALHLRQHGIGFDHAAELKHDVEHLLAQGGNLQAAFAALVEDFLFGFHNVLPEKDAPLYRETRGFSGCRGRGGVLPLYCVPPAA